MPPAAPPKDELKQLASRLVALGAIPIAVFCGAFALGRAALGTDQQAQAWTWMLALGAAVASVFVLARRTARALDAEVQVVREALRHPGGGPGGADFPELNPPLEALKREVLSLARDFQSKEQRLQERLDTSRQQVFFLTTHDPLTGLANRKTLEERLESALASARSLGGTHALVYLDIDFLHRINDAFGHLAGDELLRRIVPVLKGCLRDEELLARIGGDEFAVLIENCSADYALQTALRLRDAVQSWQFEWSEHAFQVGVSAGVVAVTRLTPGLSAIFNEADSACFAAKEQGRNRVVAFHEAEASQYMRQTSRGWLKRINDAISGGAFTLLYQPIVALGAAPQPGALHAGRGAPAHERDGRGADPAHVLHPGRGTLRPHAHHRPLGRRSRLRRLPPAGAGPGRGPPRGVLDQPLGAHAVQPRLRRFRPRELRPVRRAARVHLLRDHGDRGHRQRRARPRPRSRGCGPWACASGWTISAAGCRPSTTSSTSRWTG